MADQQLTDRTVEARVTGVDEMEPGSMKMAKVGERRVVVIRTASGFHALDNACPHQGYGLVTGALDGELLTCQWHNWKYRVTDGVCVVGEENVACHPVRVDGDDVLVSVTEETDEEKLAKLWPSLRQGIERDYRGQISRDAARLLAAGATADEMIAEALEYGLERNEWGMGHEMAVAADLLVLADALEGVDQTLPLAHALAGVAESARDRAPHPPVKDTPATDAMVRGTRQAFLDALEAEDWSAAVAASGHALDLGEIRSWFIDAVSRHHYSYGHGAIFTQKAFALIDRIPRLRELLISELARYLSYATREDTLPYMRKANREIDAVDLDALAAAPAAALDDANWTSRRDALVGLLLDAPEAPITELVTAANDGVGVAGLIDVVSLAASHRLLRFNLAIERDPHEEFGWLDITHVLTYANAARWAWRTDPGPRSARLVLLTAFLAFDSGRGERRNDVPLAPLPEARAYRGSGAVREAVLERRADDAVALVLGARLEDAEHIAADLEAASLEDTAGSFIVMAHLVKSAVAARTEAEATGSLLPLAAAARFLAAPRRERFVTRDAHEAMAFVRTGKPPLR